MQVHPDGRLDQAATLDRVNARVRALDELAVEGTTAMEGLLDARTLFEAKRMTHATRWDPAAVDIQRLRELVNERAGWNVL